MKQTLRLGVNIDHVATLRNARGGAHPDPLRAAQICLAAKADGLTIHLREDRRHIRDEDVKKIIVSKILPVNLEMAAIDEMVQIACLHRPSYVCFVPEKREERTTEGGLDVVGKQTILRDMIVKLQMRQIKVSLFIAPDQRQIVTAKELGADAVELHTGEYSHGVSGELERIMAAAKLAYSLNLSTHAGHGLSFDNVEKIAAIDEISELNIGHFLIGEALFTGLEVAIREMRRKMDDARKG